MVDRLPLDLSGYRAGGLAGHHTPRCRDPLTTCRVDGRTVRPGAVCAALLTREELTVSRVLQGQDVSALME